jgi:uncharacterized protein involved in outer membrane biogenesis
MKYRWLWLIPLALAVAVLAAALALPAFVAASSHRATIESLASALTGRQVRIGGKLSLALLPRPQLIADDVRIDGPSGQTITARSLTLDIAPTALLRGRLEARSISLQAPDIAFPWPLPGGPHAIAPPRWLSALHAKISDGNISLGAVDFAHVDADIFTGPGGAVAISGTGVAVGTKLRLTLGLGETDASGSAALRIDAAMLNAAPPGGQAHFAGTLRGDGGVAGSLSLQATLPGLAGMSGTAGISADAGAISATGIALAAGDARLAGSARLGLPLGDLGLDLTGENLDLTPLRGWTGGTGLPLSGTLNLRIGNAGFAGLKLPELAAAADFGPAGVTLRWLTASLPGESRFHLAGRFGADGTMQGQLRLDAPSLGALLAAGGPALSPPESWQRATLQTDFAGSASDLTLDDLSGSLGEDDFTGGVVLRHAQGWRAEGALAFNRLDLEAAFGLARRWPAGLPVTLGGEITAGQARFGGLQLSRLLLDATMGDRLVVRRIAGSLYGGLLAASFTLGPDGQVTAGRGLLSVPSAAPLAALLPAAWQPPPAIIDAPLSVSLRAQGPPTALATSAVATLGEITVTAAPVADLAQLSAAGPLTFRHPDAIALLADFGKRLGGLRPGLDWPGAGSVSLRADMRASPQAVGLPDFVLSAGDLTADGRIDLTASGGIEARIDADTLALPAMADPAQLPIPWPLLAGAHGRVALSANRIWLGGDEVFGASAASLSLGNGQLNLTIPQAALAGGNIAGVIGATLAPDAPPALTIRLGATSLNAGALQLPVEFPFAVTAGDLGLQVDLTANGFSPAAWAATLAGDVVLTDARGSLSGFDLAGLGTTLTAAGKREAALRLAATSGASDFDALLLSGRVSHGILTLQQALVTGMAGTATGSGSIDLPDTDLSVTVTLHPAVKPPLGLPVSTLGGWATARKIPLLRQALAWSQSP